MKELLIIILTLLLMSCDNNTKYEKPFIIIYKSRYDYDKTQCFYTYQDKNGRRYNFNDESNKYNIGDTIK